MRRAVISFLVCAFLFFLVSAEVSLPPRAFFVKGYDPQALIVVGDTASASDVIAATLLATRISELSVRMEVQVTEVVYSETEHTLTNLVPFVWSNYFILLDMDEDDLWFEYRLERLRDTIPGGFIPTEGRTWASRTTQVDLLGDYYSMLEIRRRDSLWYLFSGIPRNFEHEYFKKDDTRAYGKYVVTLLDVDVDEREAKIRVRWDNKEEVIFLPVYCKDCKHVVGELFCTWGDPPAALDAADQLEKEYSSSFLSLKYFVTGPLSNPDAVARANWYWSPPPVPGTPDMFIDGDAHIGSGSPNFYLDYFTAFYASTGAPFPLRVYTTGVIQSEGVVNTFIRSDENLENLSVYVVLFEKFVDVGGVVYRNVVREVSDPVYVSLRRGQTFEYSYRFTTTVADPEENLGVVVFVQDTMTRRIYQADVLDTKEKEYVYEVDVDADFDGYEREVEFAIECTKIPFLGVMGNMWAQFNVYTLTDYGVLYPMCCDTPFFEDEKAKWDLQIFKQGDLGYVLVTMCDPFDITCLKSGDILYGPRHLARIEVVEVRETQVDILFQFMKVIKREVEDGKVAPSALLRLASEVTEGELKTYNVICVGGPGVNGVTRRVVEMGLSRVDWGTSRGEWELIANPFGYGKDVLIVAGKDREKTSFAAKKLYHALEMYRE